MRSYTREFKQISHSVFLDKKINLYLNSYYLRFLVDNLDKRTANIKKTETSIIQQYYHIKAERRFVFKLIDKMWCGLPIKIFIARIAINAQTEVKKHDLRKYSLRNGLLRAIQNINIQIILFSITINRTKQLSIQYPIDSFPKMKQNLIKTDQKPSEMILKLFKNCNFPFFSTKLCCRSIITSVCSFL